MSLPFDELFGEGSTEALITAGTIDGSAPSALQAPLDENRVLITLVWPTSSQQVVFNKQSLNASWGLGLCSSPEPDFLQKFAAAVFGPIGLALGLKTVSVHVPEDLAAPFLALGLKKDLSEENLFTAAISPNSPLGKWARGYDG